MRRLSSCSISHLDGHEVRFAPPAGLWNGDGCRLQPQAAGLEADTYSRPPRVVAGHDRGAEAPGSCTQQHAETSAIEPLGPRLPLPLLPLGVDSPGSDGPLADRTRLISLSQQVVAGAPAARPWTGVPSRGRHRHGTAPAKADLASHQDAALTSWQQLQKTDSDW